MSVFALSSLSACTAPSDSLDRKDQAVFTMGIHFQAPSGHYLAARNNGGADVTAVATVAQAWETFSIDDVNGGSLEHGDPIFIRAGNGQYFMAQNGGGSTLSAASNNRLAWETFRIVKANGSGAIQNGDVVGLQAMNGTFIRTWNGGGSSVDVQGAQLRGWESFTISGLDEPPDTLDDVPRAPHLPTLDNGQGATVPWVEYEAESMTTSGSILGPTRTFGQVAAEASGRQAIRLASTGQSVSFENAYAANSILVRYSIPDGGADYWVSLSVYVDGVFRTKLWLTSRYSWTYGNEYQFNSPDQNNPALGSAHHFFDEAHVLMGDVPVGATVMLRKDGDDKASHYDIDLVDMEQVPGPIGQPGGYLSLTTDCGATADDWTDDAGAIQYCMDRARGEGRGVYIPPGTYRSWSRVISLAGIAVKGAGIWYSTIDGINASFDCWSGGCSYSDFRINGDTQARFDSSPETAFRGNGQSGSVIDRIWVEHTKVGLFSGPGSNNITVQNSRFRSLFADGVNFWAGTTNSVCRNNHMRGTGDDSFASWSDAVTSPGRANTNNLFAHNYVQAPWKANCFGLYGGQNRIEDNVCADTVQYPGILLASQFGSHPFSGTTTVARNTLIRAGGYAFGQGHGALKVHADERGISGIAVSELDAISPTYYGVHVQGNNWIGNMSLDGMSVESPGAGVFFLNWGAQGSLTASGVVATGAPRGIIDQSGGAFQIQRGNGNSGW